jgi:hypothetical protein
MMPTRGFSGLATVTDAVTSPSTVDRSTVP